MVQIVGVLVVNVTARPELAVAESANVVFTVCAAMAGKVMVCARAVTEKLWLILGAPE